ncbi:hypothetical protein D915_003255 [Fasciola hepatica]|uniref:Uncharacterized protein n=1 Tax=Fasciola hepatica TaxID=6192 RepID=A0A4E0S2I2_FASHE|nr:hypothetical protein D915_003255 [Fasciola hepatica]
MTGYSANDHTGHVSSVGVLPVRATSAFYHCAQLPEESLATMTRELRRLAEDAFSDLSPAENEAKILEQVTKGVRDTAISRGFLIWLTKSLTQAPDTAWCIEQVEPKLQRDQL